METTRKAALPYGSILRFITGVGLLLSIVPFLRVVDFDFIMTTVITIAAILAFYTALHFVIARYHALINKCVGAFIAVTPIALVYQFVEPAGGTASVIYVGASLILMAMRRDGGCEVMAFPALFLGKFTHLVCIAFSPIDWVEKKVMQKKTALSD